jgi:hypothetical protein
MSINGYTIYVLPCLQELKTFGTQLGYEKEQQIFKDNDTSDLFDAYWSGNIQTPDNNMTKNGLLTIPNCSAFGFNLENIDYLNSRNYKKITTLNRKIPECGDFSCSKKWAIYSKFLKEKCVTDKNVALLVTHHNRMRDSTQGLLPFKKSFYKKNPYNAYANNFCLKISIIQGVPTYSLFFEGFPDKGEFENCSDVVTTVNTSNAEYNTVNDDDDDVTEGEEEDGGVGGGKVQYRGGKKKYKYFCNTDIETYLNTELITKGITDAKIDKNLDIYVIRHGNSLHNKPVSAEDQLDRLDSSLTPLGMYQANELGGYFKSQGVFNNANIILCSSFLQRTQLTGLLLLFYAGINLNSTMSNMSNGMIEMLDNAITRYSSQVGKYGFDPTKFLGYSPLGEIIKDKNSKIYKPFEGKKEDFINFLSNTNLSELLSKSAQSVINNLIVKLSVIQRHDGWKEISEKFIRINDNDDDDDDDDAPRFQKNEGGKKRRQTKKQRVMKSKKVRRVKKHNKKSKKVKRRSNKHKA